MDSVLQLASKGNGCPIFVVGHATDVKPYMLWLQSQEAFDGWVKLDLTLYTTNRAVPKRGPYKFGEMTLSVFTPFAIGRRVCTICCVLDPRCSERSGGRSIYLSRVTFSIAYCLHRFRR
jgi:hypothetical protein